IVEPEIPERGEHYGLEVWQRIRHQLPEQALAWWMAWLRWDRLAIAGAAAALVVAAFVTGRIWPRQAGEPARPASAQIATDVPADAATRVLTAAVGDHLERSERVLLDLMNARGPRVDVREQQAWAADLVDSNRLYREA